MQYILSVCHVKKYLKNYLLYVPVIYRTLTVDEGYYFLQTLPGIGQGSSLNLMTLIKPSHFMLETYNLYHVSLYNPLPDILLPKAPVILPES